MTDEQLPEVTLSAQDSYVLARALVDQAWQDLPCSPPVRLLLSNVDTAVPDELRTLRRLLGTTGLKQIMRVNPDGWLGPTTTLWRCQHRT